MDRITVAINLMERFAERTGLVGSAPPRRYLWTDAYAVCVYLSLYRSLAEPAYLDLARDLVAQVHRVLGHQVAGPGAGRPLGHRDEAEWVAHPTAAGLRIGKPMPERPPGAFLDQRLEWERDGQYFHYLTRWMHALVRCAEVSGSRLYHRWAVELCRASLAFVAWDPHGRPVSMAWKRSVNLDRVLVDSMGQHDPLDGWITAEELAASRFTDHDDRSLLRTVVATFRALDDTGARSSADALGLGGLLAAAARRWFDSAPADPVAAAEVRDLLDAAAQGLRALLDRHPLAAPVERRLAFRELGLVIGLHTLAAMAEDLHDDSSFRARQVRPPLEALRALARELPDLSAFWSEQDREASPAWTAHLDINAVMLAASLVPEDPRHVPLRY